MGVTIAIPGLAQDCFRRKKSKNSGEPHISNIEPPSGAPGIPVTIEGKNFNKIVGIQGVVFGWQPAEIVEWKDDKIIVKVPYGRGTVKVQATGPTGRSNDNVLFTYKEPIIKSVTPNFGQPITEVVIEGEHFGFKNNSPGFHVKFGKSHVVDFVKPWTDKKIIVKPPSDYGTGENDRKMILNLITFAYYGWQGIADAAIKKIISLTVEELSRQGVRIRPGEKKIEVDVKVTTPVGKSNVKVFIYRLLSPPTWKEVPLTPAPRAVTGLTFDQNTVLNDSDFDVADTWNEEKIQALFEKRNSFFKDYINPTTGKPASWVIADRADHYQISSKILLAKMQAESSSIWDAETSRQMMGKPRYYQGKYMGKGIDWVLGFGWTDVGPIPKYKGFYNQVDGTAKLLSVAFAQPEAFTDTKGLKWSVGEPHTVYDGTVAPKNRATIALYIYTPWIKTNKLLHAVWLMMFLSFAPENFLGRYSLESKESSQFVEGAYLELKKDGIALWGSSFLWKIIWTKADSQLHLLFYFYNSRIPSRTYCRFYIAKDKRKGRVATGDSFQVDFWVLDFGSQQGIVQEQEGATPIKLEKVSSGDGIYPGGIIIWDKYSGEMNGQRAFFEFEKISDFSISVPGKKPVRMRVDGKGLASYIYKWKMIGDKIEVFIEGREDVRPVEFEIKDGNLVKSGGSIIGSKQKE